MPITMELRENNRVIYYRFVDPWSLDELVSLYKQTVIIRNEHLHTIHAIANLTVTRHLPTDILHIRFTSPDITHPRAGRVVLVGATPLIHSVAKIAIRVLRPGKVQLVATENEAWRSIREIIESEMSKPLDGE